MAAAVAAATSAPPFLWALSLAKETPSQRWWHRRRSAAQGCEKICVLSLWGLLRLSSARRAVALTVWGEMVSPQSSLDVTCGPISAASGERALLAHAVSQSRSQQFPGKGERSLQVCQAKSKRLEGSLVRTIVQLVTLTVAIL